ncbi:MAG: DUF885 domain-containing protein [Candidatus Eremiobacteraeota bacterium]|nr:DUF885 domain-containing protein [Candidatus Eremiobacteraeota bacterium]
MSIDSTPQTLQIIAKDYYLWQAETFPVSSSYLGLHTWDDRLTNYSPGALSRQRSYLEATLDDVLSIKPEGWEKDDYIDWLLFRAQVEGAYYHDILLDESSTNPQVYVNECSNAIFSLLKKDYAPAAVRAKAAAKRMAAMPELIEQAKKNLTKPVKLFMKLAASSARALKPLFTESLMAIACDLPAEERRNLEEKRDKALEALKDFGEWLEGPLPGAQEFKPMGRDNYNFLLSHSLLLPYDADELISLAKAELVRARALESWLDDPGKANPDPSRSPRIPATQQEFLKVYESRQGEIIEHLKKKRLVTLPESLGSFYIRELPAPFRPTSPGGFMNPPGLYDSDTSGFYFIPSYSPDSPNFYIRAAIEEPRPILAHEGIPGHFLQISRAYAQANEIRKHHHDGVFVEGWALYTEEMLMRTGLYEHHSAGEGQVLRLSRYRAARIEVDVNLHTGTWSLDEAVEHFAAAGGLDREAAEGEAAGAATRPLQKITYTTGKYQLMGLLGRCRDKDGDTFRLGEFHDRLLSYGSLPVSILEWIMLDNRTLLDRALEKRTETEVLFRCEA